LQCIVGPYVLILYVTLPLYVGDDNDDVQAYKTRVHKPHFIRHWKDNIQERLMILILLCSKFIGVCVCANNCFNAQELRSMEQLSANAVDSGCL